MDVVSVLLLAIFTLTIIPGLVSAQDMWLPYVPSADNVELSYWSVGKTAYIKVTLTFGMPCYRFDWGILYRYDHQLWVESKIWQYQGVCIQVETTFEHTYNFGELQYGQIYTFAFEVWGFPVESITFRHLPPQAHTR